MLSVVTALSLGNTYTSQAADVSNWADINTNKAETNINFTSDITAEGTPNTITITSTEAQTIDGKNFSFIGTNGYGIKINNNSGVTIQNFGKIVNGTEDNHTYSYTDTNGSTVYKTISASINGFNQAPIQPNSIVTTNLAIKDVVYSNNTGALLTVWLKNATDNATIKDVVFYGNKITSNNDSAIISISRGTVEFDNLIFDSNETSAWDIGLDFKAVSYSKINNSIFQNNKTGAYGTLQLSGGEVEINNSQFINNYTKYYDGGAITVTSTMGNITNSTFKNNVAGNDGGAIWYSQLASSPYFVNTKFEGNQAGGVGGAIYIGNTSNSSNNVYIIGSDFKNNESSYGGGIYSYNAKDYFVVTDTSFTGNTADEGGAIYAQNENLNIFANTKDVIFSENTANNTTSTYNGGAAVYYEYSDDSLDVAMNVNAASGRKVIFNDSIAAYGNGATLNVNKNGLSYDDIEGNSVTVTNKGEIQFNDIVGDKEGNIFNINLYGGKLSIGQNEDETTPSANPDGYINDNNFYVKGNSILNTVNGIVGEFAPKTFDIDAILDYQFDVDLANAKSDTIKVTNNNGTLNLSLFNISSDSATQGLKVKYSDTNVGGIIADDYTITTSTQTYTVSALNDDTGSYVVFSQVLPLSGLPAAIYNQSNQYAITNDQDENVTAWAPSEGNIIKSDIDINGNGNFIYTENGLDGMVVSEGKNVVIRNVEELTGFNNALTNNGGTLTVTDTSVVDNTGDADITNNGGTLNINANTKDVVIGSENTTNAIVSKGGTVNIKGLDDNTVTIDGAFVASDTATINVDKETEFNDNVSISDNSTMNISADTTIDTLTNAGNVVNKATMDINGGENSGKISGTGTLNASGVDSFTNSGSIEQNIVNITDNTVFNNTGTLTINESGSLDDSSSITGGGSLVNNGTFNNNGTISQKTLTNANSFTSDASKLEISDGILNSGDLNLTGGILDTSITGEGKTNITGDVTVKYINSQAQTGTQHNKISQDIDVAKTASLNANAASIGGNITVNAEGDDIGVVTLYSQEPDGGDLNYTVTGDGTTNFNRNVNVKADVTTNTINIATYNDGRTDYNANVVVSDGNQFGINGGTITIDSGNTLTMNNASDLATEVINNGVLRFVSGTNNNDVTGNGETLITGNVNNQNNIDNNITVNDNANLINNGIIGSNEKNVINNGNITNNGNILGNITNNGIIDNIAKISGIVTNNAGGNINTTIAGLNTEVTNHGDIHFTDSGSTLRDIKGNGTVHIDGNGTTTLNNDIDNNTLSLNNGNLIFGSNKDISKGGFIANGGNIINIADGKLTTYKLGNTEVSKNTGIDGIDFNLNNLTSDKFIGNFSGSGKFVVDKVRIQGNTTENYIKVSLSNTTNIPNNNLNVKSQELPEILTPIRWLKGNVEDNYLIYQGRGGGYSDFNPAVEAATVAAQVGGYNAQMEAFEHGFYHMNRYTKYASSARLSAENYNKVAITDTLTVNPKVENPLTEEGIWTKPYTSWESVHLKHGPHVKSFGYGNFFGGDTDLVNLGNGFKGVLSAFIGYNGNHLSYDGISMDMQGGTLGITGTAYKGNFFTGITASTGASGVEAYTPYGTEHFGMINAGIANKTGYNWEIKGGRLIVQPTLLVGYTFVNTFDYTNAAGARIETDPYSSLQIVPELKVIGNTESGWQPYAKVGMVYNVSLGNRTMTANDVKVPQLSNRAYVQYGIGIQRSWSDRFTAFFETLLRGGGRNGVMLFGGFRWTLGRDNNKQNLKDKTVKTIKSNKGVSHANTKVIKHI